MTTALYVISLLLACFYLFLACVADAPRTRGLYAMSTVLWWTLAILTGVRMIVESQ